MGDVVYGAGMVVGAMMCVGTVGLMSLVLVAFVVGEAQRIGRKRATRRRAEFETDMLIASRREIEKRALRLMKERKASHFLVEDEERHFEGIPNES